MSSKFNHFQAGGAALLLYLSLSAGGIGLGHELTAERFVIALPVVFAALAVTLKELPRPNHGFILFVLLLIFLLLQASRAIEISEAFKKIDGFLVAGLTSLALARYSLRVYGIRFLNSYILVSIVILIATVVYKYVFGFWDRGIRFFINGPIVFAWLCAIAILLCAYMYRRDGSKLYLAASILFCAAILWSESKGPLLSLIPALILMALKSKRKLATLGAMATISCLAIMVYSIDLLPTRFHAVGRFLFDETTPSDFGSITIREIMARDSLDVFNEHTLIGVGMSNWRFFVQDTALVQSNMEYPHNWIFEVLAEHGIVGMFFLVGTICYTFFKTSQLGKVCLTYFLISLFFSGDLSYWRFLIFLPLALDEKTIRQAGNV